MKLDPEALERAYAAYGEHSGEDVICSAVKAAITAYLAVLPQSQDIRALVERLRSVSMGYGATGREDLIAEMNGAQTALLDALSCLAGEGWRPKVKPLEWRDHRGHTFPDTWTAKTPCGVYEIEERSGSDSPFYVVTGPLHVFIADKDGLPEAKAAAQADFDRRIISALDLPAPSVEEKLP